jgi:hypothetical protein
MFTNRTIAAALFTIAIASSLIAVSGFVGSAYAAKNKAKDTQDEYGTIPTVASGQDKSKKDQLPAVLRADDSQKSKGVSPNMGASGYTNGVSKTDLKSLTKCQAGAAADGDLTLAEVKDCYSQVF